MKKRIPKITSPKKVQINGPIVGRISGLKFIGLDMAKEGERDKSYAYFVNSVKNGIVIEGCTPILDELESLSPWAKHDVDAILKRPSKDTQDKINGILFASTKNGDLK